MRRRDLLAIITAAGAVMATTAMAQTSWTMASGYPESSFFTQNIREMIADIDERTDGQLKIDLRSNDSLIKLDNIKRAVQSGQIQIGEIRLGVYSNEAAMYNLDNIPGVATDYDQAARLLEAQIPFFADLFASNGMRVLAYEPWPGQGFYTKEPVTSLDDLQGQKLRIYSRPTQVMGEALGMESLILPFAEVPQAFATGMIDALWTSPQTGTDVQIWDYTKHFTYTGTMHNKNAIIMNERAFQQLDEETQKAVLEAGEAATRRAFELSKQAGEERIGVLAENGMTIADAPQDILDRIDAVGIEMVDEWLASASEAEAAVYEAYRASLD